VHHTWLHFFFFFVVLGVELKALLLLGGPLPLEPLCQPVLYWLFSRLGLAFFSGMGWILILLFVLPHMAGMTGAPHCAQLLVEMGVS
jgi:hypothetical protein